MDRNTIKKAAEQLKTAGNTKKCLGCGCFHDTIRNIDEKIFKEEFSDYFIKIFNDAKSKLKKRRYECLGCEVCYPAVAINIINELKMDSKPCQSNINIGNAENAIQINKTKNGWPPFPGDYIALTYKAEVAICTLNDAGLTASLAKINEPGISIVGTLHTENLGIEHLIINIKSNPNIRALILCGEDSKQVVGHLPGQSLLSLYRNGIDETGRIIGAKGKRPVIKNIDMNAINYFRNNIDLINMIGINDRGKIKKTINSVVSNKSDLLIDLQPAKSNNAFADFPIKTAGGLEIIRPVSGYLPEKLIQDPNGYFIIYVDKVNKKIMLEHYKNNGILDIIINGDSAVELYTPVIDNGLVSRFDHACYLGKELSRAEEALKSKKTYIQDMAPKKKLGDKNTCNDLTCKCHH